MPSSRTTKKRIERSIEEAVVAGRGDARLGYDASPYIRRMRAGENCGTVDLLLLPRSPATHKVVLIEAKRFDARDVASQVLGQLLMYHTGILQLGSHGLEHLRQYAARPGEPVFRTFVAAQEVCPRLPNGKRLRKPEAWSEMQRGEQLTPGDVALFVALNGPPKPSLCQVIGRLYQSYCLEIGVIVVTKSGEQREIAAVGRPSETGGMAAFRETLID